MSCESNIQTKMPKLSNLLSNKYSFSCLRESTCASVYVCVLCVCACMCMCVCVCVYKYNYVCVMAVHVCNEQQTHTLTAGTALDKLLQVYKRPAYVSPCSKMTFYLCVCVCVSEWVGGCGQGGRVPLPSQNTRTTHQLNKLFFFSLNNQRLPKTQTLLANPKSEKHTSSIVHVHSILTTNLTGHPP